MSVSLNRWSAHPYFFINGDLDFRVIKSLAREMSFFVEGFERTKKYKEGRWDGQECLLYKSKKGVYYFPVGMIDVAKRVFSDFEVDYFVQDIKLKDVQNRYKPLDLKWTGHELRDYQTKAVMDIKNNEGGTICLPTGSGKTLVMLRIIYEYNLPCLILVHTKELLYQWEKNIKAFFNGRCPGLIGDGHMSFDPITVAMMQTLSQKIVKDKMENLDYPILMIDECFPYNTDVITENGVMKIGDIVRGKLDVKVLTHTGKFKHVVGWHEKPITKNMVRVNHECGSFECTEDHKILTDYGWVEAKYLVCGSVVYNYNDIYAEHGDGSVQDVWERVPDVWSIGRACECGTQSSGNAEGVWDAICCTSHTGKGLCKNGEVFENNRIETFGDISHGNPVSNGLGKLDGGYEHRICEYKKSVSEVAGSSRFKTIRVCSVEVFSIAEYRENTAANNEERGVWRVPDEIQHTESPVPNYGVRSGDVELREEDDYRGLVKSDNRSDCTGNLVHGRRGAHREDTDVLDGKCVTSGSRNGEGVVEGSLGYQCDGLRNAETVDSYYNAEGGGKEVLGSRETTCDSNDGIQDGYSVFDITVEDDHSYTANGIVVSNCHHAPCETLYMVAQKCNAPVRIGSSATPRRTDGADIKIWAAVGEIKSTITADELIKRGILAKPEFVFLTPPPVYCGKRSHYSDVYLQGIVINEGRNDLVIKKAKEYSAQGLTTYVHVVRIDHGEMLKERIPGSVFLSGKDNTTLRQATLKKFAKGEIKVLISTLLGEGTDVPSINCFIAAGAGKSPIGVIQRAGRALRIAPGKKTAIIVDFRDSGKYLGDHWSERYNTYKEIYGDYVP